MTKFAIVDSNTLSAMGLRMLLEKIVPMVELNIFSKFQDFIDSEPDEYFHYFVSSQVYLEHNVFFLPRCHRTMILVNGSNSVAQFSGAHILDITKSESELVRSILKIQHHGHQAHGVHPIQNEKTSILSSREIDVLSLVVKGLINKEIADKLNIGITTVITHRKNIVEKLGIKSVSGLTIFAAMNGYIDIDSI